VQNYFRPRLSDIAEHALDDRARVRERAFVTRIVVAPQQTLNTGYIVVGGTDLVVSKGRGALALKKLFWSLAPSAALWPRSSVPVCSLRVARHADWV